MASTPESAGGDHTPNPVAERAESVFSPETGRPDWRSRLGNAIRSAPVERKFLWILLLLFVAKGVFFTFSFPAFSGHDEVAHYAYLRFVAEEGRPPLIPDPEAWEAQFAVDRNQRSHDRIPEELWQYCRFVTQDWKFCDDPRYINNPVYAVSVGEHKYPAGWVYTGNHPPLYYLVMTPVYWLSSSGSFETQLYILRLAAIPFGMLAVIFAYRTSRVLFPASRFLAMTVPAFVAFQPQISYESAMLNNDIFAIAFTSVVFYLIAVGLRKDFPWRTCVLMGLFFGLAMLSKSTSLVSGGVIAVAMILGLGPKNIRAWLPKGVVTAAIGGLLIWPWYLYMYRTYGDFTALSRIQGLQWWNYNGAEPPSVWAQLTNPDFAWMRWKETWGEFGWRLIPLDRELLWFIFWVCAIGLAGVVWWTIQAWLAKSGRTITMRDDEGSWTAPAIRSFSGRETRIDPVYRVDRPVRVAVLTLIIACVLAYYAILQFGTTFSLTQARYYFPSVNAVALLIMLGYRALLPRQWLKAGQVIVFLALVALNIVIFSQYTIPYWGGGV